MKRTLVILALVAGMTPLLAAAADLQPLAPEQVTLDNGDVAIRCATLGHLAKKAGFFNDVENGSTLMKRFNMRMLEIALDSYPEASNRDLKTRMWAAFTEYKKLGKPHTGKAMKGDFQVCLARAQELFGPDLLPNE